MLQERAHPRAEGLVETAYSTVWDCWARDSQDLFGEPGKGGQKSCEKNGGAFYERAC